MVEPNFAGNVLLTKSCKLRQRLQHEQIDSWRSFMDAKWNNIVDNTMVRIAMVVVGFGAWLAIGYSLLAA